VTNHSETSLYSQAWTRCLVKKHIVHNNILVFAQKLAIDENCVFCYGPDFCAIQKVTSNMLIGMGDLGNTVYYLRFLRGRSIFDAVKKVDQVWWHQRLGHLSCGSLAPLYMLCDFNLNKESLNCCDVCHRTKQTQNSFLLSEYRASSPFDLVL